MAVPSFLRIWVGSTRRARCRTCRKGICWGIDDRGKHQKLDPSAKPIRLERDDRGRQFRVFEATAKHRCVAGRPMQLDVEDVTPERLVLAVRELAAKKGL